MTDRLIRRVPWTLLAFVAALCIPLVASRFYTSLATDILILALFATSLNLLLGTTGLVSFGHAAYFAAGAYTCGILMKNHGIPFAAGFAAAGIVSGVIALAFGFFCVRLTKIYFAMLTLAFAQIVWAICFKWNDVTGGEQGLSNVPYPDLGWMAAIPGLGRMRVGEHYFYLTLVLVAACFLILRRISESPFGRILTTIRENPERAEFIGIHVRRYELAAFVVAGIFAGLAGALFGIFNRGVFPDFGYWSKSAEVLIMVILGGMGQFWGPLVGAFTLTALNQQITSYTEFWPMVLGLILIVLLYAFPAGILGTLVDLVRGGAMLEVSGLRKTFSGFVAIADVSFSVERRQIAAVIGPNGAGKSTLFNLITGHIRPETGRVLFDENDITGTAPPAICRMGMGRSFQHANIFPKLTVFQNVQAAFIAHRRAGPNFWGKSRDIFEDETRTLLRSLGLLGQADTIGGTLSYGNQKQLELGIALAADPKMLLLDEPTAGMSASETRATIELLQQIALERELTLLFTEHDMDVVFAIAQKIAVLHQGQLIAAGTPTEVRGNPEVRRVYLGEQRT